jgi:hypothetical protein
VHELRQIYVLIGAVCCLIGVVLCLVGRDRSIFSRLALFLLPPMAFVVTWNWYYTLVFNPIYPFFSADRLAPAVALTYGYQLYYPAELGPVNGWIYPPAAVLAYLPATLASDPPMTVLVGCCLSLLFYFGPFVGLLTLEVRRRRLKADVACLLFAIFAVLSSCVISLHMVSTMAHADAPALGFGAVALGLVGRIRGNRLGTIGFGAIVAATCAALSKQVQAPLVLVPALWVTATGGIRNGLRSLAITVVVVLSILIPVALLFGPEEFFFNTWIVPSKHGFKGTTIGENTTLILWSLWVQLQRPLVAVLLFMLVCIGLVRVLGVDRPGALRDDPIWLPFLIGGFLEIPSAIIGYVKRGGDFNGEAYATYPLAIALVLILGRCVGSVPRLANLLVLLTMYLGVSESRGMMRQLAQFDRASSKDAGLNPKWIGEQRLVLRYLREHPGEAYFPYNILDHLAVDKRLYHFEAGVDFQTLSGYPLGPESLREFIPPRTRIICYPAVVSELVTKPSMPGYLGNFSTAVSDPELPGFVCFAQSTAAGPGGTVRGAVGKISSDSTPGFRRRVPDRRSEPTKRAPAAASTRRQKTSGPDGPRDPTVMIRPADSRTAASLDAW